MASVPENPACVINCVHYDGHGRRHDIALERISDVLAEDDGFVWVGMYEPGDDVLQKLQEEFQLHDLAIEDTRMAHQRPKVEAYGNSLFLAVHTAQVIDEPESSSRLALPWSVLAFWPPALSAAARRRSDVVASGASAPRATRRKASMKVLAFFCSADQLVSHAMRGESASVVRAELSASTSSLISIA